MSAALLLTLLCLGGPDELADLERASRAERERAVAALAARSGSGELVGLWMRAGPRGAAAIAAVLARRPDAVAWDGLLAAAGHDDPARGEPAAEALVRAAANTRRPLPGAAGAVLRTRLDAAVGRLVPKHVESIPGGPSTSRPHLYRALLAAEEYAARALAALVAHETYPPGPRAHALHALLRIEGRRALPVLRKALAGPDPVLRRHAAQLVLRYGDAAAWGQLVDMLEQKRALQSPVRMAAISAVGGLKRCGPRGLDVIETVVAQEQLAFALSGVRALVAVDPARGRRAARARVAAMAGRASTRPRDARGALLFHFAGAPIPPDLRAPLLAHGGALAAAVFGASTEASLAALRPLLKPGKKTADEWVRVRIASRLLEAHDAPTADRLAFARRTFRSGSTEARRLGLQALVAVPAADRTAASGAIRRALHHPVESLRLAAAALLPGDASAFAVCLNALYDSDPRAARTVLPILQRGWPDLGLQAGSIATARQRRDTARKLLASAISGKD
ncbi:MAG: HEAT repeat domain-containing protein [Planctomycetota bacterium]|nr:HEAT repeat domain-containing protein [Planctomycetota bacterium]